MKSNKEYRKFLVVMMLTFFVGLPMVFWLSEVEAENREIVYYKDSVSIVYDSDYPGKLEVRNKSDDIIYIELNGESHRLYRTAGTGFKGKEYLYFDKNCKELKIVVNSEEEIILTLD